MDEASAGDALVGLLPPPTIAYLTVVDVVFVSDVNSSPSKFSLQLLDWYNNEYLKEMDSSTLIKLLSEIGSNINENFKNIHGIIDVLKVGAKSLKEIENDLRYSQRY